MSSVNHLHYSILKTLAYFDIVRFPLTQEELFRYLWQPPQVTYEQLVMQLPGLIQNKSIAIKWGYYFLPHQEETVARRRSSTVPTELKLRRARFAMRLIGWVPFLKAVFVSSSVAAQTAHEHSDIDFFIITAPGRIWLVRFFVNLTLRICGIRIYGTQKKDRICVCFFVDSDHLNLSPWRISSDDIHFMYWLHQMMPIYDPESVYKKFIEANQWTQEFLPHISAQFFLEGTKRLCVKNFFQKLLSGLVGDFLEKLTKKIQWFKLKKSLKEKAGLDTKEVVTAEGVLKFHEHDTREKYREEWLQRCREFFGE